jgi:hypothetical protein
VSFIFSDGFDWLAAVGDITMRWDTVNVGSGVGLVAAANTAFGVGGGFSFNSLSSISKAWGTNDGTVFATIRHKQLTGTSATVYFSLQLFDAAAAQVTIRWNEDTSITVMSGGPAGTLLGTAAAGAFSSVTWDSWQIKAVIHNTTGSVEIRKNGSATPILSLTNVNTRAGSTNAYCNKVTLANANSSAIHQVDDFLICSGSGAAPNDWTGDLRGYTEAPTGTAQSQFSFSPTTSTFGQTLSASTISSVANNMVFASVAASYTGTVASVQISTTTALTGGVNMALYDATGAAGAPGALLAQSTGVTSPSAGVVTFAFASPPSVTKGQALWVAVWTASAVTTVFNGTTSAPRAVQTLTYTGTFPASAGAATSTGSTPYMLANVTLANSLQTINETAQDGDTSYVYSSTVGQEDLYTFPTLASAGITPLVIAGVVPFAICKRSDSGSRTVSVRCKSGATDAAVLTDSAVPLTYAFRGTMQATDPATGAAWTTAGLDAMSVGAKIDA